MQIPKVALLILLAGAAASQLRAQPASPENQARAIELLRQTIAQDRAASSTSGAMPESAAPMEHHSHSPASSSQPMSSSPGAGSSTMTSTPMQMPMPSAPPAAPAQQEQALQMLRQTIAQDRATEAAQTTATKAASKSQAKAKSTKAHQPSASSPSKASTPSTPAPMGANTGPVVPNASVVAPTPGTFTGPKTKQQQLADLLELYKADKLTPAQYQVERAKILAQP